MRIKKLIILSIISLMFCNRTYSQTGSKYFDDKNFHQAAFHYETEAIKKPEYYLNLAKSYFALKQFHKSIESLEKYKNN